MSENDRCDEACRVVANRHAGQMRSAPPAADLLFSAADQALAAAAIGSWSGYRPTPLHSLDGLAGALGVARIYFKDESERFGLGSFKALGGAYAVYRQLADAISRAVPGIVIDAAALESGKYADITRRVTVSCATDGNHGRSVAWGAQRFGCRCIIFVHKHVSQARRQSIAAYGADVRAVDGNYDDSVRAAALQAAEGGWLIISDTSYEGYTAIPRQVMQGYTVMVDEALRALPEGVRPSHVFVQAGVGGLAAAVCAALWQRYGVQRPVLTTVEPLRADCVLRSAQAGALTVLHGDLDTIMAGLACGEVSTLAWEVLETGCDFFMNIPDQRAADTMRLLASGRHGDIGVVSGESGAAGLAGLCAVAGDDRQRGLLGLDGDSIVLVFGTEGDTDPEIYRQIVGCTSQTIRAQVHFKHGE